MNPAQLIAKTRSKLAQITAHFQTELGKTRTGRAHPSMVDSLSVEVYGQPMPLKAVASVTAPEAQLLQITPFDPNNLSAIAEAIRNDASLGLSPTDDGRVVRINLPPLTSEDRQRIVKVLHQKLEETHVAARQARHEALKEAEAAEKAKQIGKDERERLKKQIDELMEAQKAELDKLTKAKETEILTV